MVSASPRKSILVLPSLLAQTGRQLSFFPLAYIRSTASRSAAIEGVTPAAVATSKISTTISNIRAVRAGSLEIESIPLFGHLDHSARVHDVVRNVENVVFRDKPGDLGVRELII